MEGINESVGLIVDKLGELIKACGGEIRTYYPYVFKQQIIMGWVEVIALIFLPFVYWGIFTLWGKDCISDSGNPTLKGVIAIVLSLFGLVYTLMVLFSVEIIFALFNPHYYAVQKIIELGKSLLK